MFSKYEEISKLIRNYIEESLSKPMVHPKALNEQIKQTYSVSLSETDLVNLQNTISAAKKARQDYKIGVENSFKSTTNWDNALAKARDLAVQKEGTARNLSYGLANKLCIMLYKGPLTLDTMKELKEHGYDGTYGSTTMMQMYSLYTKKDCLEQKNEEQKAQLLKSQAEVTAYRQQYTEQFQALQTTKVKNEALQKENEFLKISQKELVEKVSKQNEIIQALSEKVEQLSKKLPIQIIEGLKSLITERSLMEEKDSEEKTM
jgi:hypothetical protein